MEPSSVTDRVDLAPETLQVFAQLPVRRVDTDEEDAVGLECLQLVPDVDRHLTGAREVECSEDAEQRRLAAARSARNRGHPTRDEAVGEPLEHPSALPTLSVAAG